MDFITPRNHPWKPTTGYETVDAFRVPSQPITSQRGHPSYVPKGMCTTSLKFPNLVTGFNRNPIHAARAALNSRYTSDKWFQNNTSITNEIASNLNASESLRNKINCLIREKEELNAFVETIDDESVKVKLDKLSKKLEYVIEINENMQNCKRKLQTCIQAIEAPLQISQECLENREFRNKNELVNDNVEQMLMKENEIFRQSQKHLENCLANLDNKLLQNRQVQYVLESHIKSIQWIVIVDKSQEHISNFLKSDTWSEKSECLLSKTDKELSDAQGLLNRIESDIKEKTQIVTNAWLQTNKAFAEKLDQLKETKVKFECLLVKIKNEISNVEKSLQLLKTNKEFYNQLQQGEVQLDSLFRTKSKLESDLSSKINSLFIDEHKCMTIRRCYPISIIASC